MHLGRAFPYIAAGVETGNLEQVKALPAMLAVGMHDRGIRPENAIADFKGLFPDAPVNTFDNAGHFCQEDIPQTLVALIHQFIQANP